MGKGAARRCCSCSSEAFRVILWMSWVTNMLISGIYIVLQLAAFYKLSQASVDFNFSKEALFRDKIWRAPLAALILGALLVFGFNLMSCIILIKKSINRSGPGFGYGFMVAYCFTLAFFCLLCGLVLDGFRDVVKTDLEIQKADNGTIISGSPSWTKYSTELFIGAEVFALLEFCLLMFFFLVMVIFQSAVADQLGIGRDMSNPYSPMEAAAMMAPPTLAPKADGLGAAEPADGQYASYGQYNDNSYNSYYHSTDANGQTGAEQQTTEYRYSGPSSPTRLAYQPDTPFQTTYQAPTYISPGYPSAGYQAPGAGYGSYSNPDSPSHANNPQPPPPYSAAGGYRSEQL